MSLSARLIESYEDRKLFIGDISTSYSRPAHLAIPRSSTPLARPPARTVNMDPNESWMSHHGQQSFTAGPSTQGTSSWSEERIQMLQARLVRKLGPEYVTQRPGPGGGPKLSYIEGWKVINLANEVFGFNGWSSSIVSLKTDYIDEKEGGRVSVNVTAIIRITLLDGCYHEDVGCGQGENIRGKSAALDKAQKEAVTDATKRALRTFGNVLGNCLYDKEYTKEVVKIKVPPAKFNQNDLERRPEFMPAGAPGPSTAPQQAKSAVPIQQPQPIRPQGRVEPPIIAPGTPLKSVNDHEGDVFMDEHFDAEFLDDSFLNQIENSNVPDQNGNSRINNSSMQQNAQAGPSRSPDRPTYQHRHRPDALQQSAQENSSVSYNQPGQVGSKPSSGNSAASGSGGSGKTLPEAPNVKPRHVGGFAAQGGNGVANNANSNVAAASARRLAMASAMHTSSSPPIRAESPKIPSGGINDVAARAITKLKNEREDFRINGDGVSDDGENVTLGGFASARGVKRNGNEEVGDRRSASPTKPPNFGQGQTGYNRQGPRTALGELSTGIGGDDWAAKRSRIG